MGALQRGRERKPPARRSVAPRDPSPDRDTDGQCVAWREVEQVHVHRAEELSRAATGAQTARAPQSPASPVPKNKTKRSSSKTQLTSRRDRTDVAGEALGAPRG